MSELTNSIKDSITADPQSVGEPPGISVVMPVYNGVEFITQSIPPLIEMFRRGELVEVLVVDDGSTDNTVALSQELGATVLHSGGRLGPGGARNQAASSASGNILWFVDADVVVHDNAAKELASAFTGDGIVAVFGSYDDEPPAQNFFSQYKNLVHHYYHHRAKEEASTFWSGCGAVRKSAFLAVDGFDVERYKYPSIEDIELGHRLISAGGRVRMCPSLLCTHLKIWRLGNLLHTEIFRRAIPWSRLILGGAGIPDDLNTGIAEQAKAVLAAFFFLSMLLAVVLIVPWYVPLLLSAAVFAANFAITSLFFRRRGVVFAIAGLLFHQVYYVYSATAFGLVFIEQKILKLQRR